MGQANHAPPQSHLASYAGSGPMPRNRRRDQRARPLAAPHANNTHDVSGTGVNPVSTTELGLYWIVPVYPPKLNAVPPTNWPDTEPFGTVMMVSMSVGCGE